MHSRFTATANPLSLIIILFKEGFEMHNYEEVKIEMIKLSDADIITASGFDGEDDEIGGDWNAK